MQLNNSSAQKLAAACFLIIFSPNQDYFHLAMNEILSQIPKWNSFHTSDNVITSIYQHCSTAIQYALERQPEWSQKYLFRINEYFDPIRIVALNLLSCCIEKSDISFNEIQEKVEALARREDNSALSFAAWQCLSQLIFRNNAINNTLGFQEIVSEKLKNNSTRKEAISIIAAMVQRQKRSEQNVISEAIFGQLSHLLMTEESLEIKRGIIFIIAKLFENHMKLDILFPVISLSQELIDRLVQGVQREEESEYSTLVLRYIAEHINQKGSFLGNVPMMLTHFETIESIVLKNRYSEQTRENIIVFFYNIVQYERVADLTLSYDRTILFNTLHDLLKADQFVTANLNILGEFAQKSTESIPEIIFEELVFKLKIQSDKVIGDIQFLFKLYIQHHQHNKLPNNTIISLAKALGDEQAFIPIRPILNYLIIFQQRSSTIPIEAIEHFIAAASSEQEEIAMCGAELLFHARKSLLTQETSHLIREMKGIENALNKSCQYGLFKITVSLLRTIFATHIIPITSSFESLLIELLQKISLPPSDREKMYEYLVQREY